MTYETAAIAIGSVLLGIVQAVAAWRLLKGIIIVGLVLVLVLSVALYVGSFFVVSSLDEGDHQVRKRTYVYQPLLHLYASLRWTDIVSFGTDGFACPSSDALATTSGGDASQASVSSPTAIRSAARRRQGSGD
jgi:hypothetical protein